jgi:hypothetical protein
MRFAGAFLVVYLTAVEAAPVLRNNQLSPSYVGISDEFGNGLANPPGSKWPDRFGTSRFGLRGPVANSFLDQDHLSWGAC